MAHECLEMVEMENEEVETGDFVQFIQSRDKAKMLQDERHGGWITPMEKVGAYFSGNF